MGVAPSITGYLLRIMTYQTPRMLARTLKTLRRRRKLTLEKLAPRLGRTRSSISAYECRDVSVTYELLERYQCFFGAPNGIILVISHLAAIARDASTASNPSERRKERERLELMARYLRNLSDRILDPGNLKRLSAYSGIAYDDPSTWDALLKDIFDAAQDGVPQGRNRLFENPQRLASIVRDETARRNRGGDLEDTNGGAKRKSRKS